MISALSGFIGRYMAAVMIRIESPLITKMIRSPKVLKTSMTKYSGVLYSAKPDKKSYSALSCLTLGLTQPVDTFTLNICSTSRWLKS